MKHQQFDRNLLKAISLNISGKFSEKYETKNEQKSYFLQNLADLPRAEVHPLTTEAVAEITSAEGLPLAEVGVEETGRPMEEADTKSTQRRR